MSKINTEYLERGIRTLEESYKLLKEAEEGSIQYEIYRNSLVKGFEMTIEQGGKLLRRKLAPYFASKREVDQLTYKDLFRHANKRSIIDSAEVGRWFVYRDNRNSTAYDYGEQFAEDTLSLMGKFIVDAYRLLEVIADG